MEQAPVLAVFNTSLDVVDLLRDTFQHAGFVVVTALTYELRDSSVGLEAFIRQHDPDVILYDIAPPYEENWRLLQHMASTPALRGRPMVLTTTNAKHVAKLAGSQPLHEIVGKPYDLQQIVDAVRQALPPERRPEAVRFH